MLWSVSVLTRFSLVWRRLEDRKESEGWPMNSGDLRIPKNTIKLFFLNFHNSKTRISQFSTNFSRRISINYVCNKLIVNYDLWWGMYIIFVVGNVKMEMVHGAIKYEIFLSAEFESRIKIRRSFVIDFFLLIFLIISHLIHHLLTLPTPNSNPTNLEQFRKNINFFIGILKEFQIFFYK